MGANMGAKGANFLRFWDFERWTPWKTEGIKVAERYSLRLNLKCYFLGFQLHGYRVSSYSHLLFINRLIDLSYDEAIWMRSLYCQKRRKRKEKDPFGSRSYGNHHGIMKIKRSIEFTTHIEIV